VIACQRQDVWRSALFARGGSGVPGGDKHRRRLLAEYRSVLARRHLRGRYRRARRPAGINANLFALPLCSPATRWSS